jgi:hypothetical protein
MTAARAVERLFHGHGVWLQLADQLAQTTTDLGQTRPARIARRRREHAALDIGDAGRSPTLDDTVAHT